MVDNELIDELENLEALGDIDEIDNKQPQGIRPPPIDADPLQNVPPDFVRWTPEIQAECLIAVTRQMEIKAEENRLMRELEENRRMRDQALISFGKFNEMIKSAISEGNTDCGFINAFKDLNVGTQLCPVFSKPINECKNLNAHSDGCRKLVCMDDVIKKSFEIIVGETESYTDQLSDHAFRKSPLVFSRLARGGKTTTLRLLFDKIINTVGYNVMIISFNGSSNFKLFDGESQSNAILRLIAKQWIHSVNEECMIVDRSKVDDYIGEKKFVLLIDEINMLGTLDEDATNLLRQLFLNKKSRYLVMTTHIPMVLGQPILNAPGSNQSFRNFRTVSLPETLDMDSLRNMSEKCESLTLIQALMLGGIPSLIYSTYGKNEEELQIRFDQEKIDLRTFTSIQSLFAEFTHEFLHGIRKKGSRMQIFDMFASVPVAEHYRWPLCYAMCIVKEFHTYLTTLRPLIECFQSLETYAKTVNSGKDWELVIEVAILFRFYDNQLNQRKIPFNLSTHNVKDSSYTIDLPHASKVEYIKIPDTIKFQSPLSHLSAESFIMERVNDRPYNTLFLFTPTDSCFETVDGFAVYSYKVGLDKYTNIAAYQVKKGNDVPRKFVETPWINCGCWLIGDKAPKTTLVKNSWTYMSRSEICDDILGYSLAQLYPTSEDINDGSEASEVAVVNKS